MRRLAGPLEADQHEDLRRTLREGERLALIPENVDQLLVDNRDDCLTGRERLEDILANGALPYGSDEILGDLEIDVGLEQRTADFAHRLIDILLSQMALA